MITLIKYFILKHKILKAKLLMWEFISEAAKSFTVAANSDTDKND